MTNEPSSRRVVPALAVIVQTCRLANRFAHEFVGLAAGGCSIVLSVGLAAVGEENASRRTGQQPGAAQTVSMIIADSTSYDFRYSDSTSKNVVSGGRADNALIQCLSPQVGIEFQVAKIRPSFLGENMTTIKSAGGQPIERC